MTNGGGGFGAPAVGGLPALLESVVHERRHSHVLQSPLACPREGIMLHYDDSSRDDWAVEWFMDPRCTNGYTWLVLDDGRVIELADPAMRTPHAGACRTPNANSRFYGIAAATNGLVPAATAQIESIVKLCVALFNNGLTTEHTDHTDKPQGRSLCSVPSVVRVVGHDTEAIWNPATTRAAGMSDERGRQLWGRGGRKVDPTGVRKDRVPIINVAQVRTLASAAPVKEE